MLGTGPLVDRVRDMLVTGGQEPCVVAVPVRGQPGGYISDLSVTGTKTGATLSGYPAKNADVAVRVATGGLVSGGAAMLEISTDGGKTYAAAVPAAAFDAEQATALNDKLLRATITEVHVPKAGRPNVGGHPLCLGCQVYRTGLVGNVVDDVQQSFPVMMAKALGGDGFTTPIDPSEDEIYEWVRRAESYTSIVIGTYNGHLHPQQLEMVKALAQNSGKPVTVVALRNPYDLFPLPESVYTLAAYEYTARSTAAVADVLLGRHAATGRLPIATPEQEAQ